MLRFLWFTVYYARIIQLLVVTYPLRVCSRRQRRAQKWVLKTQVFRFLETYKTSKVQILGFLEKKTLKSRQIQSHQKIVAFQSNQLCLQLCYSVHMSIISDVAGNACIMYEIFFVNFQVIILCPVFVHKNIKTYIKTFKT